MTCLERVLLTAMRRLGVILVVAGFAVGLIGTMYGMVRSFTAVEPGVDIAPYIRVGIRATFAGMFITFIGAVLFLASLFVRQRRG